MALLSGGGGGSGSISGVTVTGTAAAGQVPVASSSSAGAWAYPPGFEIGYTEITAAVNIVSTTEATGTTIISPGALTFDGGPVICEFFAPFERADTAATTDLGVVSLFEAASQISRLCVVSSPLTASNFFIAMSGRLRFTPTAAAHTYTITAFVTSTTGTPSIGAGAKGTAAYPPAFVRFVKV